MKSLILAILLALAGLVGAVALQVAGDIGPGGTAIQPVLQVAGDIGPGGT